MVFAAQCRFRERSSQNQSFQGKNGILVQVFIFLPLQRLQHKELLTPQRCGTWRRPICNARSSLCYLKNAKEKNSQNVFRNCFPLVFHLRARASPRAKVSTVPAPATPPVGSTRVAKAFWSVHSASQPLEGVVGLGSCQLVPPTPVSDAVLGPPAGLRGVGADLSRTEHDPPDACRHRRVRAAGDHRPRHAGERRHGQPCADQPLRVRGRGRRWIRRPVRRAPVQGAGPG
eukprot:COSAG04_NODE_7379_length_1137_cov_1.396917_1_plen_230_part_00